jgi:hypothetical protein
VLARINFITPKLSQTAIISLLVNGGFTCGLGDWRQEKGSGNFGLFEVAESLQDARVQRLMAEGGRDVQIKALETPQFYDDDTERLYTWLNDEVMRRGKQDQVKRGKKASKEVA